MATGRGSTRFPAAPVGGHKRLDHFTPDRAARRPSGPDAKIGGVASEYAPDGGPRQAAPARRRKRPLVAMDRRRSRFEPGATTRARSRFEPGTNPELHPATTERRSFLVRLAREKQGGVSKREQERQAARHLVDAYEHSDEPRMDGALGHFFNGLFDATDAAGRGLGAAKDAAGGALSAIGDTEGDRNDLMRHQLVRAELADPGKPGVLERLSLGFYNPDAQGTDETEALMQRAQGQGIDPAEMLDRVRDEGVSAREALARMLVERRPRPRRGGY